MAGLSILPVEITSFRTALDSYIIRASEVIWEAMTKRYDFVMRSAGYGQLKFETNF
jgi:hypothetical protein